MGVWSIARHFIGGSRRCWTSNSNILAAAVLRRGGFGELAEREFGGYVLEAADRAGIMHTLSALDAAAKVLAASKEPMRARDLIAAMADQGLWSSPNGKTPEATLYAAMIREIAAKGGAPTR